MDKVRYLAVAGQAEVVIDESGGVYVNDERVNGLAPQEYKFLVELARAKGQVRTATMLHNSFYGKEAKSRIFDVYACRARSFLGALHRDAAETIRNVWGRGYAFGHPTAPSIRLGRHLDLPPCDARWFPSRKIRILRHLKRGRVSTQQLLGHYPDLSLDELMEWHRQY